MTSGSRSERSQVRIEDRFVLFDLDGSLAEDAREIWSILEPEEELVARAFWAQFDRSSVINSAGADEWNDLLQEILPYIRLKFENLASQKWVDVAQDYVLKAASSGVSTTSVISAISATAAVGYDILVRVLAGDSARLARLGKALTQATMLEVDVFAAHHDIVRNRVERQRRSARGVEFNKEIMSVVERTASDSRRCAARPPTHPPRPAACSARPPRSPPPPSSRRWRCARRRRPRPA